VTTLEVREHISADPATLLAPDGAALDAGAELAAQLSHRLEGLASAEPGIAYGGLAAVCVPALGDTCVVELIEDGVAPYQVCRPGEKITADPQGRIGTMTRRMVTTGERSVRTADAVSVAIVGVGTAGPDFLGALTCTRRLGCPPGRAESHVLEVLVAHTTALLRAERLQARLDHSATHIDNLMRALESNRSIGMAIGILMADTKRTESEAFDALRRVSQYTNRKLRDVAADVLYTGALPTTVPAVPKRRLVRPDAATA
jgi:ANTAR domain